MLWHVVVYIKIRVKYSTEVWVHILGELRHLLLVIHADYDLKFTCLL